MFIAQTDIVDVLSGLDGPKLASILVRTEPMMNRIGNPFHGRVAEIISASGIINDLDLLKASNNRVWGKRVEGTPWIEYGGYHYLEMYVRAATSSFVDKETGEALSNNDIWPHLRLNAWPWKQNMTKSKTCRDFRLDHILQIKVERVTYRLNG